VRLAEGFQLGLNVSVEAESVGHLGFRPVVRVVVNVDDVCDTGPGSSQTVLRPGRLIDDPKATCG